MPTAPKQFNRQNVARQRERYRGNCVQRGYDWHWMKISKMKRAECPVCEICNDALAVDVDHIIPFKGLTDPMRTMWRNLRSACRACHNAKTRTHNEVE